MYQISTETRAYLEGWLAKAARYQTEVKQRAFELTLDDFLALWGDKRLAKLDAWINTGMWGNRMHRTNPYAFVLTWRDREAMQTGVMNIHTAQVSTRAKSQTTLGMIKGEKHTDTAKAKMRTAKLGTKQSKEHVEIRAAKMRGVKRGPMSEEQKRAISEGRKRARAAKDGAQ